MTLDIPKTRDAATGLRLREAAKHKRLVADTEAGGDPTGAWFSRREADQADQQANEILTLPGCATLGMRST